RYGTRLFVTSLDGQSLLIYPLPVWEKHEEHLDKVPDSDPDGSDYGLRVNFFGQEAELDSQGRVVIQARLRESAAMLGDVSVVGRRDYLHVWNFDRLRAKLDKAPFTNDQARVLAQYGV